MPVHIPPEVIKDGHWLLIKFTNTVRLPQDGQPVEVVAEIYDSDASKIGSNYVSNVLMALSNYANDRFTITPAHGVSFFQKKHTCGWFTLINGISLIKNCSPFEFSLLHREFRHVFAGFILSHL